MREGEALPLAWLGIRLQRAGDGLSDELDEEEEIDQQANIPYLNLQKRRGLLGLSVDLFGIKSPHARD
jgi:hypothetical protein